VIDAIMQTTGVLVIFIGKDEEEEKEEVEEKENEIT
jgi:hypothetical protein